MKRTLRVARAYPHPPELVWEALTDPELIGQWLMRTDFAPVKGHRFQLRTDPAPGFDGIVECQVLDIDPPRRMRWSWRGGPIDTEVAFTLTPVAVGSIEGTRLEVEHTGFEGLPAVLVSFILQAGNRRIYGRRLPAVLDARARPSSDGSAPAGSEHHRHGLWWVLAQLFAPILRRQPRKPPR